MAAIRTPTTTAMNAKNSVVLNAALVSVLSRRVRCGAGRAPWVKPSVRVSPVRVAIEVLQTLDYGSSDCLRSVANDQRLPPEGWESAPWPWAAARDSKLPGSVDVPN